MLEAKGESHKFPKCPRPKRRDAWRHFQATSRPLGRLTAVLSCAGRSRPRVGIGDWMGWQLATQFRAEELESWRAGELESRVKIARQ